MFSDPMTTCMVCNGGYVEILDGTELLYVAAWTAANNTVGAAWPGFTTTLDVSQRRGATLTYRLRVNATASPPTLFLFDVLSLIADRCD